MKSTIILIALCAACMPATARNRYIVAYDLSVHAQQPGNGKKWNELNVGLGIRYEINSDWSIQTGQFKNLLRVKSSYVIADYTPISLGGVQAGAFAGRVSGYPQTNYAAGLLARASYERASLTLRATPQFKGSPSVIALEL